MNKRPMLSFKTLIVALSIFATSVSGFATSVSSFATCLAGNAAAETNISAKWPHEISDLRQDPAIVFGNLANGFRYILMENQEPKDRVSLHLNVQAGSIQETDSQQGLAHFLEHMLFCGSEHFKPGELIKYFQSIGMEFGADANAHTSFHETVYDVILPKGDLENMAKGLLVVKDYANGALLLQSEIDRERKVILAEKRTRDSASFRTIVSSLKFEFPESKISHRIPIGIEKVIKAADRSIIKEYYDTWYSPENMILVMVGDFDAHNAKPLIEKKFSDLTARASAKPSPDIGNINHKGTKTFYHFEKEAGETSITIETISKVPRHPDSFAFQKETIIRDVGNQIVQDRLNTMVSKPDTPFTSAGIASGIYLHEIEYAELNADCSPENWQKSIMLLEQTLRRALKYGFTDTELEKVKKSLLSDLDKAVRGRSTRKSRDLANKIIWHLNNDGVFQSPEQEKELYAPVIKSLTSKTVHLSFKKAWGASHRLVLVTGNADLNQDDPGQDNPEKKILSAMVKSGKVTVFPPAKKNKVVFPYLPEPEKKDVIKNRKEIADLGIVQIDFANNIRLNIKKTDFKADEVILAAGFGQGRSYEPKDKPGLSSLCTSVINESGAGKLTKDDLKWALAGKNTHLYFNVGEERFSFHGRTVSKEVPLLFQLLYTQITDPLYKQDAYLLAMERFKQKYKSFLHTIEGAVALSGKKFLSGGDSRFGFPSFEIFKKNTLDDIEKWVITSLKNDQLEVSIVGDFDVEAVVRQASKYLGNLPKRNPAVSHKASNLIKFPEGKSLKINVTTKIPKGMVDVSYPTEDFWNIKRTRRFIVLGHVFSEMMRLRIREELGATYSAYAYNRASRAYSGYGVLHAAAQVDPEDADQVVSEIKRISENLSRNGVGKEQHKLALDPVLTGIKDTIRTNGYWLNSVLIGSKEHPEQLEWSRTIIPGFSSITAQELSSLAKQYLDNDKAALIVIKPEE